MKKLLLLAFLAVGMSAYAQEEKTVEHNNKKLELAHLKITSRDTKGTKVRI